MLCFPMFVYRFAYVLLPSLVGWSKERPAGGRAHTVAEFFPDDHTRGLAVYQEEVSEFFVHHTPRTRVARRVDP